MSDDGFWVVPLVFTIIAIFAGGAAIGAKVVASNKMDNCMQYYKSMPLQEIEPLCKKILEAAK